MIEAVPLRFKIFLATALLLVLTPLAWLVTRDSADAVAEEVGGAAGDLTFGQALASSSFWIFALSLADALLT